jgi:uncharacterized protein YkwD
MLLIVGYPHKLKPLKQEKVIILTLLFICIFLHTLQAQRTTASSRARQQVASKAQVVTTANATGKVTRWNRSLYNTINHTNFRNHTIFHQPIDFDNPDYGLLNACIFFITNEKRAEHKLPVLQYARQLEIAAWNHSKSMGEGNWFEHENPKDKSRHTTDDRAILAGILNPYIAENIVLVPEGYFAETESYIKLADFFVNGWMNSPGHRENILSDNILQAGCGVFKNTKGDWYGTQNFQVHELIEDSEEATDTLPE